MKSSLIKAAVYGLATTAGLLAASPSWDLTELQRAPQTFPAPAEVEVPANVKALSFAGLPWQGKPTKVFAYYGIPAGATKEHPAPGIVLVHGGGGTAFARWVSQWVDRGYAAIAFDHDGNLPIGANNAWTRNPEGGPNRGDIQQLAWPLTDQWMYHAVADTLLAHSLLASFPEVDPNRIGATGISWGGVILSIVAGIDSRLKFAAPVYGCGFIAEESNDGSTFVGLQGTPEQRAQWSAWWDPKNFLPQAKLPMIWLDGTNDFAFTPKVWQQTYRLAPGPRIICMRVRMPHGHNPSGEGPEEILALADHVVRQGKPLLQITGQGVEGGQAWATYVPEDPPVRAILNFTCDTGKWQTRKWDSVDATIENGKVQASLPPGTTVCFLNLIDERGLIVSSEHVELGK